MPFTLHISLPFTPDADGHAPDDGMDHAPPLEYATLDAVGHGILDWAEEPGVSFTVDGEAVVMVRSSAIVPGVGRVKTTRLYWGGRLLAEGQELAIPAAHVAAGAKPGPWCGICSDPDHTTDECFSEDS